MTYLAHKYGGKEGKQMEPEELGAVTPWIVWANGEVDLRLYDFADKDGPET